MYRKYLNNLIEWMNDEYRKPLVVWGARQVGKTYLIKNIFAETYYKSKYVYIDCRTDYEFVSYCKSHVNAKDVINYISLDKDIEIDKDTLLIFDEIQECISLITLLKYFCQDYREIPVIVTGSMVRIKLQRENKKQGNKENGQFLFPVGKINQLTIYPLNFEEYLYNSNKNLFDFISESYKNKVVLEDNIHQLALNYFFDYMLLGGMPEVVDTFLKTKSYQKARETLIDLYNNYLGDMQLYQASPESIIRSNKIFKNIYFQLNKDNKNFKSSLVESNLRNRDLINPIDWLELAFLVLKSSLLKEHVTTPLIQTDESLYRLYLSDMGLFSYQSGINAKYFLSSDGRNTMSGIFFENYVASELIHSGYKLFYWKGKNNFEFEFLIESGGELIPIDVKKNKGCLGSLNKFKDHNHFKYALKVSMNKYGFDEKEKILTMPYYYLCFYLNELRDSESIDK